MSETALIPLFILGGFLVFRGLLWLFYPLVVLLHELAHAIPARLWGKPNVTLQVGNAPYPVHFEIANVRIQCSWKGGYRGHTRYQGRPENWAQLFTIVGTAPVVSLLVTLLGAWVLLDFRFHLATAFLLCALWLANTHIALSSLRPTLQGSDSNDPASSSDLDTLIRGPFVRKN